MNQDEAQQDEQQRLAQIMAQISPPNPNGPPGIALPGLPSPYNVAPGNQTIENEGDTSVKQDDGTVSPITKLVHRLAYPAPPPKQDPNQNGNQTQTNQTQGGIPGLIRGIQGTPLGQKIGKSPVGQQIGKVLQNPANNQGQPQPIVKPGGLRSLLDELLRIK